MTDLIPVLETERLRLRGHHLSDLAPFTALWTKPDFYRFLGGQPLGEEDAWTKMLRHTALWVLLGYGYWAVEEKATGEFVGAVGFGDWQRAIEPSLKGIPEAGWIMAPHVQGRGYGTEAVQAALAWGDDRFHPRRTVCIIDPGNAPSLALAHRVGYREMALTEYKGKPIVVLAR
ncbi:GNAT family N-acetyltransferase [Hymenobacter sp. BT175]|uniref:GNAT family N-acetyltransferase n=1 Tax=Hymenobacter translucens TaxID=2886507 RepID=UPI001D0EE2AB|nr:GNAT family N-acetyltransferase [Hymenobacter translucens]MCC2545446.1 GNAT family N-acetyltransferase [Hymenobacter translucens]